jgi:hypothetical protein
MLYLCIERMFGLTNGCRILEIIFLQASYHDSGAQYRRSWGSFKRKRGLTLCYSCRKLGHLPKEFPGGKPSCLCCKYLDHEVLDFPRMIFKLERMNLHEENPKKAPEIAKPRKELEKLLIELKETLNGHKDVSLSEFFKEKEKIEVRIGDFGIDYVPDEETHVNIMIERTWKTLGKPIMIPSLGGIIFFKGKLVTLCGRITQISLSINGTSVEEEFEFIKFI